MSYTPPPPPPNTVEEKVPPVAWLVPVGAVLAVIGAFTPWFKPVVSGTINGVHHSESVDNALYSWKDGRIGLIAPILLALVAFGIVALLTGREAKRFSRGSKGPVVSAARGAIIAGVVSLVAVIIAWFLLPSQYKFTEGGRDYSWDDFQKLLRGAGATNVDIGRGPQVGYWLTIAGAVLALVGGVLMLVMRSKPTEVGAAPYGTAPQGFAAPGQFAPPAPGSFAPPAPGSFAPPAPGQQPAPQQGWAPPQQPPAPQQPPVPPQH